MELNQPAEDFSLPDISGVHHKLSDFRGRIVVVNFWSAECPQTERTDRTLLATLRQLSNVVYLPIASNRNEPAEMIAEAARQRGIELVLLDQACGLADLFGAQTTPHAYVIDSGGILRYRGAVDDVTFRKRMAEKFYVEMAVEAISAGNLPGIQETQPYGCTIVREV